MKRIITLLIFTCSIAAAQQRDLKMPQVSQAAKVMQRIGLTDISVSYNSPLVKGRKIWGDVVPFNEIWRAGANENTVITFSTDVMVEGKKIAAGSYGLHMIPTTDEWTIIFSKNADAWGSFFYDEKEDALRVNVKTEQAESQDWLSYTFRNPQENGVVVLLRWERIAVPVKITVDVPEVVYESMKKELTNINGFFWPGFNQAAQYCIRKNIHLDQAAVWVDKSIAIQKNFTNLNTKASLLAKQNKQQEADALKAEALTLADETQLNAYGYDLLNQGRNNEAIEIFRENVKRYPSSWNVYDSLAEALERIRDNKGAIDNYKKALSKAPESQKKRITETINKISGK